ncbi:hypothetical protein [Streptomyces sp. S1D4-20]|uniref:hypothetical protein n=1 Tax=Streptomyces sp. S1D4-20 TaxID=2594462 RepID=UPI0011646522|nr:hypothetical protein [Streptomyces sp. S1D4-20]QDN58713.1 hypothetical protein FNV67_28400 [Streptomyces sp. S1D4-20]
MTTRTGYGRPRLVASAAGRGPAVHKRYRMRLRVDERGWVSPRSADDKHGFMDTYEPGTVVELDIGVGCCLRDYDAVLIAECVSQCAAVYLVSSAATGTAPCIEGGCAYNADGVLDLIRMAIDHVSAHRDAHKC